MACGEFAKSIYRLIEELGDTDEGRELVLDNLIKFLPSQTIESFVESFRRDYDMSEDPTEDFETNEYVLSVDKILDTHQESEAIEHTQPPKGTNKFFSSLIPEC